MKLRHINLITNIVLIASFCISTGSIIYISRVALSDTRAVLHDLNQLERNVKIASQALREAALAPSEDLIEKELSVLKFTKPSSTEIYNRLIRNTTISDKDRAEINALLLERPDYRLAQLDVVKAIRLRDKALVWNYLLIFKPYQDTYSKRVETLIHSNEANLGKIKDRLFFRLLVVFIIFFVLQAIDKTFMYQIWKTKNTPAN